MKFPHIHWHRATREIIWAQFVKQEGYPEPYGVLAQGCLKICRCGQRVIVPFDIRLRTVEVE